MGVTLIMKIATDSSLQEPSAGGSTQGPDRGKWAGMAETTMNGDEEGTKAGEADRYTNVGTSSEEVENLTIPAYEACSGRVVLLQQGFFRMSPARRLGGRKRVRRYASCAGVHSHGCLPPPDGAEGFHC